MWLGHTWGTCWISMAMERYSVQKRDGKGKIPITKGELTNAKNACKGENSSIRMGGREVQGELTLAYMERTLMKVRIRQQGQREGGSLDRDHKRTISVQKPLQGKRGEERGGLEFKKEENLRSTAMSHQGLPAKRDHNSQHKDP